MSAIAAIQGGNAEELKRVLAADPAAADERDGNGVPAVLTALYFRRRDLAEMLVEAGATIDFCSACALGLVEQARELLDGDANLISSRTGDGWTALHLAAFFGQADALSMLLERGADPLARSTNEMANLPLHAAAAARQTGIVRLLLDAGTPVDAAQHGGFTAAHSAAQGKDQATLDLLLERGARMDARSDDGKTPADLLNG